MSLLKIINNGQHREKEGSCAEGCNAIPDGFIDVPPEISRRIDERLDFMREKTTRMGYRFVGRHSAVKVCSWTKESIRGKNYCYKKKFYGIESSQCVQMTPAMFFCTFNCKHCWRNFAYLLPRMHEQWDDPLDVLNGCIEAQREVLQGFWGSETADKRKLSEAMDPKHVAISLSGEPTLYPYLPEFVDEITGRNMTAFLVSNGTVPAMIRTLVGHQPTNLYISFYGTTPEMYADATIPMIQDFWPKVMESLSLFKEFECNTVMRLTLSKGLNFTDPKGYAAFAEKFEPKFVEVKAFMAVGGSRRVMKYEDMPLHNEIQEFAAAIERYSSYRIIDEKPDSRVVLLTREGSPRFMGIE
ncbi:MAG: 4-demethylwyosine synthase TYW1 [Candidatus Aenigmarchaeota archaeon]|nr:4-demethylwyosine synthase TYW1 [Candidatus Aenigmarchaeota archaeon]